MKKYRTVAVSLLWLLLQSQDSLLVPHWMRQWADLFCFRGLQELLVLSIALRIVKNNTTSRLSNRKIRIDWRKIWLQVKNI